jgi:hypothetical protein
MTRRPMSIIRHNVPGFPSSETSSTDDVKRTMARFIRAVRTERLEALIRRQFRRIITPIRMSFILGLLRHRHERLRMLVEGP